MTSKVFLIVILFTGDTAQEFLYFLNQLQGQMIEVYISGAFIPEHIKL
jgi:hypothetical protein